MILALRTGEPGNNGEDDDEGEADDDAPAAGVYQYLSLLHQTPTDYSPVRHVEDDMWETGITISKGCFLILAEVDAMRCDDVSKLGPRQALVIYSTYDPGLGRSVRCSPCCLFSRCVPNSTPNIIYLGERNENGWSSMVMVKSLL